MKVPLHVDDDRGRLHVLCVTLLTSLCEIWKGVRRSGSLSILSVKTKGAVLIAVAALVMESLGEAFQQSSKCFNSQVQVQVTSRRVDCDEILEGEG